MTTSTKKASQQFYGEYINPTIEGYSSNKGNPLVLMAQVCQNIGKELSSPPPSSSLLSKQRKSISPEEKRKSLKRTIPTNCSSSPPKKPSICQPLFTFDSLFYQNLNKTYSDLSLLSTTSFNSSVFSPLFFQSSYLMDPILSSPFTCNWINSNTSDGFCGKRFISYMHLLEHLSQEHTSIKSSYPFHYPSKSIHNI